MDMMMTDSVAVDDNGIPVPQSLDELVSLLHQELGSEGLDSESIDVSRIHKIMENYQSDPDDWERFALFDGSKYTRNLVDNGNGKFNLMILCWGAGQASPIHDHSNSHCLLKILEGDVKETQYFWPHEVSGEETKESARKMVVKQESSYPLNAVSYMHDKLGLHRISNPSPERGAVTLHLYTPPYDTCRTFEENTSHCRASGKCVFYSENGQKCRHAEKVKCSLSSE